MNEFAFNSHSPIDLYLTWKCAESPPQSTVNAATESAGRRFLGSTRRASRVTYFIGFVLVWKSTWSHFFFWRISAFELAAHFITIVPCAYQWDRSRGDLDRTQFDPIMSPLQYHYTSARYINESCESPPETERKASPDDGDEAFVATTTDGRAGLFSKSHLCSVLSRSSNLASKAR